MILTIDVLGVVRHVKPRVLHRHRDGAIRRRQRAREGGSATVEVCSGQLTDWTLRPVSSRPGSRLVPRVTGVAGPVPTAASDCHDGHRYRGATQER